MKKGLILTTALAMVLGVGVFGGVLASKNSKPVEKAEAADYSSTIRVYLDFDTSAWGTITDIRIGGNGSENDVVASSSNAKYNQSLGNYVKDISSSETYEKMGCFFKEDGTQWQYQYDGGYIWIDDSKFQPGYEFQIKAIGWVSDGDGYKNFGCQVFRIGEIRDNAQNSTFYFVDGHSWHMSSSVTAYFWGGTASCSAWPGEAMVDSSLRIKAFVGETEYAGLHIYQYTLSGSAAYVKFSNNNGGSETGDLALVDGGVYFFGVDGAYQPVVELLVSLKANLGSYTYEGKEFANSICHLTQSQAADFIATYDNLVSTGGSGVASSVQGSGIITYDTPKTSNTHTGEVSLEDVYRALVVKYPSIPHENSSYFIVTNGTDNNAFVIIAIVASIATASAAVLLVLKKKKRQ